MVLAAAKMFLEKGYDNTTISDISNAAGMTHSTFFSAFEGKPDILRVFVEQLTQTQYEAGLKIVGDKNDPLFAYTLDLCLQMYIAESSEALRNVYVSAFSLERPLEQIVSQTAIKNREIFKEYYPGGTDVDFYEQEIAACGVTRAFLAKPCSIYFNIEQKLRRYLDCIFRVYRVPDEKREELIEKAVAIELTEQAKTLVEKVLRYLQEQYDMVMAAAG